MPQILYTEQELRELAELQEIDKSLHSQYRDVAAERSNFLEKNTAQLTHLSNLIHANTVKMLQFKQAGEDSNSLTCRGQHG